MDREPIPSTDLRSGIEQALFQLGSGQHTRAEQIFVALITTAREDADTYLAWLRYGEALLLLGKLDDATEALLRCAQIAARCRQDQWLARAHEALGDLAAAAANWFGALRHYRYARRLAQSSGERSVLEHLDFQADAAQKRILSTIPVQNETILLLQKEYVSTNLSISFVHRDIFLKSYFARCLECSFCHDWCCSFGADVDVQNVERIRQHQAGIRPFVRPTADDWFESEYAYYEEYAGNQYTRIKTAGPRCVFISKDERGCGLHRYAISQHMDYHEIKPLVCILFPLSFGEGILTIAPELDDSSLVCAGAGASAYRSLRSELKHYFGQELVEELDGMEKDVLAVS